MSSFSQAFLAEDLRCSNPGQCITCSLRILLFNYKLCKEQQGGSLNITDIRSALAAVHGDRFKVSEKEDSVEALWAVLTAVHSCSIGESTQGFNQDACERSCSPKCVTHRTFALELAEQLECKCEAQSELNTWSYLTYSLPFYTGSLTSVEMPDSASIPAAELVCNPGKSPTLTALNQLAGLISRDLAKESNVCVGDISGCPFKKSVSKVYLLNLPSILSVNLIWPGAYPKPSEVLRVMAAFPPEIRLSDIFSQTFEQNDPLKLSGFILFGLSHYIGIFRSESSGVWRVFDDSYVKELGTFNSYTEVIRRALDSGFHPVLVFYEKRSLMPTESQIPHLDWINIEKWAFGLDESRARLIADIEEINAMEFYENWQTNWEIPEAQPINLYPYTGIHSINTQEPDGLQSEHAAILDSSSELWVCDCGMMNPNDWLICKQCDSLKQGMEGWVCQNCKVVNNLDARYCVTCEEPSPFEIK